VWKAVETKAGKVRMAEAKRGIEKREKGEEIRRERTEKRRKENQRRKGLWN